MYNKLNFCNIVKVNSYLRHNVLMNSTRSIYSRAIDIDDEVYEAIKNNKPVVALESTIITHGMPYPKNLEMAKQVEKVVRENGAIPATIAVLNGKFKVGLNESELEKLARPYEYSNAKKMKISRKDLVYASVARLDGGTTVAATMILAHQSGIKFFATGGIGGVHRGVETSMDISTDLTELSRTPVTVVCAGIKSILDIPKTLEVLETYGVPVVTLNSPQFPAFFTNDSGISSPQSIETIDHIASMVYTSLNQLQLQNGMIVAVPNPSPADSLSVQSAIDQALIESKNQNITGNEITPFLLARIQELTQGKSLDSNIALVLNNAKIASQIAVAYEKISRHIIHTNPHSHSNIPSNNFNSKKLDSLSTEDVIGNDEIISTISLNNSTSNCHVKEKSSVLFFGASVMDIIATSNQSMILGSSNPGHVQFGHGGVARNIAARMSQDYHLTSQLVTAFADDNNGKILMNHLVNNLEIDISSSVIVKNSQNKLNLPPKTFSMISDPVSNDSSVNTTTSTSMSDIIKKYNLHQISTSSKISTANYLAIHNNNGEHVAGIADMNIFQYISPNYILSLVGNIRNKSLVVIDANFPPESFKEVVNLASTYLVPVFYEPTSDAKCCLPIQTGTISKISIIKPNISELVSMVNECYKLGMIKQSIVSVEKSLYNIERKMKKLPNDINKINTKTHSMLPSELDVDDPSTLTDIRNLALALYQVMNEDSQNNQKSISLLYMNRTTTEGIQRKVRGKHILLSMGRKGVLWIGPKLIKPFDKMRSQGKDKNKSQRSIITSHNLLKFDIESLSPTTIVINDDTVMNIFPAISLYSAITISPTASKNINTNGAGDAFCAGLLSSLLDDSCDELDNTCIYDGLISAANCILHSSHHDGIQS